MSKAVFKTLTSENKLANKKLIQKANIKTTCKTIAELMIMSKEQATILQIRHR